MSFIIQTALLLAVLYSVPALGVVKDEAGIVGATLLAVVGSGLLFFVYDLIRAPIRVDDQQEKKIARMRSVIAEMADGEQLLQELSQLHEEGIVLYYEYQSFGDWQKTMQEWDHRVMEKLQANFSVASVHRFKNNTIGLMKSVTWRWENIDSDKSDAKLFFYTSRLDALNSIVTDSGFGLFLGPKADMDEILEDTKSSDL